ncbi:MAG: hypothetical protein C0456_20135 [Hyphomonas sp.]|uniref:ankyrin repeat domain-containing protein n=1 Tax=Hyphomonas sp. TaxID=87 RepID=UPI001D4753C1|nr:ankyrin repeat domain-containing protein [Hyphomonas sp.]MBA4082775.1 hypothetical protein [Erythrobacter sp.]MBA4228909.1 hypothetical protein [Hyphomonas sp.]
MVTPQHKGKNVHTEAQFNFAVADAIDSGDVEVVRQIIRKHPEQRDVFTPFAGGTWLHYAAGESEPEIVLELLDLGFPVNAKAKHDGEVALVRAASAGRPQNVKVLLSAGSEIDSSASVRNPLFAAIVGRSADCVTLILGAGVDATIRYNTDTMKDMDALAFALMRGERECAEVIARWMVGDDDDAMTEVLAKADEIADRNAHA